MQGSGAGGSGKGTKGILHNYQGVVKMKRYLLFFGEKYYPSGGWKDFGGGYDSVNDAITAYAQLDGDWAHVIDTQLESDDCQVWANWSRDDR